MSWLSETWIQTIGWTLVHSLWIVTLIAIGLRLLLAIIPSQRAKARYLLAVAALLGAVIALVTTGVYVHEPVEEVIHSTTAIHSVESFATNYTPVNPVLSEPWHRQFNDKLQLWLAPHLSGILVIWFSGMLFFLLRGTGRIVYLHRLTQLNTQPLNPSWKNTVAQLIQMLKIRRKIIVRISPHIRSPFVAGFLKPMILLPLSAFSQLSPDQLEAILAHELAHIRRWDDAVNWLQVAVEIVLFYHPALWWISQVIRDEREKCCDDLAVAICGSALVYTKALTQLESLPNTTSSFALALSRSGNGLLGRVERLLQPHNSNNKSSVAPIIITMILAVTIAINYQFDHSISNSSTASTPVYSGLISGLKSPSALETTRSAHDSPWQPVLPDWLKEESIVLDTIPSDTIATNAKEKNERSASVFYFSTDTDQFKLDSLPEFIQLDSLSSVYSFSSPGVRILSLDSLPQALALPPNIEIDVIEDIDLDLDVLEDIEVLIDSVQSWNHSFNFHFSDTIPSPGSPEHLKQFWSDSTRGYKIHRFASPHFRVDSIRGSTFLNIPAPPAAIIPDSTRLRSLRYYQRALANVDSSGVRTAKALERQLRSLEEQQQRYEAQVQMREQQHEERLAEWQKRMEVWEDRQQELQQRFEERQQEMQQRHEERVRSLERQEEQLRQHQELLEKQFNRKEKEKSNQN
ncbi:MAG: M56 family metallopeptidase [Tunicatimonas sp.]|uniref:M56 family metallopeptidase n=1 Tax=Tunicatimonas sp. TaxID=1940096 RepID=UPI003C779EF3